MSSLHRPPGRLAFSPGVVSRRRFISLAATSATTAAFAGKAMAGHVDEVGGCTDIKPSATADRPDPQENWLDYSLGETALAFRNHGMQAELLREPITPLGAHYLLIHFDIPHLSQEDYSIAIDGRVERPMRVSLQDLKGRTEITQAVTMECAGTGRSTMKPRAVYVPWIKEAIGTYSWTGTPLRPLLEEAGLLDDAVEVLFTGWDHGIDLGVEHAFERALPVEEALSEEVMLAWAANGQPLLPQHGYPLRLVVPSWYGMASVKWLRGITVLNEEFKGVEQAKVYRYQQEKGEEGEPVQKKRVHSVIMPPGIPDLLTRTRYMAPGRYTIRGAAWSGEGKITAVEVSTDDAQTWKEATLIPVTDDPFVWTHWETPWDVDGPGEHVVASRAHDDKGNVQPLMPNDVWNRQGMGGNWVQRIPITVQADIGASGRRVPSEARVAVEGAEMPKVPEIENTLARP